MQTQGAVVVQRVSAVTGTDQNPPSQPLPGRSAPKEAIAAPKESPTAPSGTQAKETATECLPTHLADCEGPPVIDGDEDCHPHKNCGNGRVWVDAEYLLWWIKNGPVPVTLVTTGTPASQGVLGVPGTVPLFQDSNLAYSYNSGGRVSAGFWFNACQSVGLEGNGFLLERTRDSFPIASGANGLPLLASPFVNSVTQTEAVSFISLPGQNAGKFLATSTDRVWGAEGDLVVGLYHCGPQRSDLLLGFRYMDLTENLDIFRQTSLFPGITVPFGGGTVTAPQTISIDDSFATRNQFFGGTIGYRWEHSWDCFCLGLEVKGSLGTTRQVVNILGLSQAQAGNGTVQEVPGGLLALAGTNVGRVEKYRLAGIPEGEFKLGYHVCRNVLVSLGYNFIYWSSVVRPGDQLNRTVNTTFLPTSAAFGAPFGAPQPQLNLHATDFWVQGISAGLAIVY
jgi:hypothetical protein